MGRVKHYGKLDVVNLPSEVKKIWYSKDVELEPCEPIDSYWPTTTDCDLEIKKDFAKRLLDITPLTEQEEKVIYLIVFDNATLREAGKELDKSQERIRQILIKALRKFRNHQVKLTGIPSIEIDDQVMPWFWYQHEMKRVRHEQSSTVRCNMGRNDCA
jgi:hypothetical protein